MTTTTKPIYHNQHLQCIRDHGEQLRAAQREYLRLCGFINEGDIPWILSAVSFIMERQALTIEEATSVFLKRCGFYVQAVQPRPTNLVPGLDELSHGVQCNHTQPNPPHSPHAGAGRKKEYELLQAN